MNTLFYCISRGLINIKKNLLFSIASSATVAACIFMFCMFFSVVVNVSNIARQAETTIGISVFFNEDATDEEKSAMQEEIIAHGGVREISYKSADEAWESFKEDYFGENAAELAEAFADDNPLAQSDSFEIFMENIDDQEAEVEYLGTFGIVREINYSNSVVSALRQMNTVIAVLSVAMIGILFAVSVFLISNTINTAAHFRRRENEIMRLIGATNSMIRAPFVVEGTVIGLVGALLPLGLVSYIYIRAEAEIAARMDAAGSLSALSDIVSLIPFAVVFPYMLVAGLALGVGMGFIVSFITIGKHLKV